MKIVTYTGVYVSVEDFEAFILTNCGEEALSELAEKLFIKHCSLDLKKYILKYTPASIISKVAFGKECEVYNTECWRQLEQTWLEHLAELEAEDVWEENFEK